MDWAIAIDHWLNTQHPALDRSEDCGYTLDDCGNPTAIAEWRLTIPPPTVAEMQSAWASWQAEHPPAPDPSGAYAAILIPETPEFALFRRVNEVARREPSNNVSMAYMDFGSALNAAAFNPAALSGALANLHQALVGTTATTLQISLNADLRASLLNGGQNAGFTSAERATIAAWAAAHHLRITLPWAT